MSSAGALLTAPPSVAPPGPAGFLGVVPDRLTRPLLVAGAAAVVVFVLALAVTSSLVLACGAAVGVVGVVLMMSDPLLAVLVYIGVEVSQVGSVLQQLGVPSPFVLTHLFMIVALVVAFYRGQLRVTWSPVLLGALVLLASRVASLSTAYEPGTALATIAAEARDLTTLLCMFLLLWTTVGHRAAVRVAVVVLGVLGGLTVVQEYLLGNSTELLGFSQVNAPDVGSSSSRHTGPVGDPNFWGRVLLMFVPFGIALALAARSRLARVLWWTAAVALILGVFLSQSRGAYLATAAAVLVLLLLAGWRCARWLALSPLFIALLFVIPATGERLATLGDLREASSGGGDLSLVLRLASQEAGLRMFSARPLLGVGAGNYEELTPRFESGLAFATVDELGKPLAPHNAFLEFAAEGGLVGVVGLGVFLGALLFAGMRAWRAAALREPAGSPAGLDRLLAAAAVAALTGWCVASVVLHVRQFRTLLVLCAIIACLDAARSRGPVPPRAPVLETQRRFLVPWAGLGVLVLVALVGLTTTGGLTRDRWRAEAVSVVTARGSDIAYLDAYHYDLLTRGQVVPTLAAAIDRSEAVLATLPRRGSPVEVQTTVRTQPRSSDVLLVVEGDDRATVVATARQLPAAGAAVVETFRLPFVLRPAVYDERQVARIATLRVETLIVAAGLVPLLAMLVWAQFQAHHRANLQRAQRPTTP